MSLQHIRNISIKNVRGFAAAAAKPKSETGSSANAYLFPREEIQTTQDHNVVVSSVETNKPLAKLAVYYKAGTRFEQIDNLGVVHTLRVGAGLATGDTSRFGFARNIEQVGGNFFCTAGREHIAYTLEVTRDKIVGLQDIMRDVTSKQLFKHWEVSDNEGFVKHSVFSVPQEARLLDNLHKAAYRRGLGNSLYTPKCMIGEHSKEMLTQYVKTNFVEASVVGVGVPHEICQRLAKRIKLQPADRIYRPSEFYSGEIRKDNGGELGYVALGFEGAGFTNGKEMVAAALAARALGTGVRTLHGNLAGKLATAQVEGSHTIAFSSNYSDSGIIGVMIVGLPKALSTATKKAADTLRAAKFADEDISRAKNILKADLSFALESESELADDMGLQSLFNGKVHSYSEIAQLVDTVTTAEVNNLVKQGLAKLSLSAIGNIGNVPYLDELGK